jgi:hypothetical protein
MDKRIEEIKKRESGATPGPWAWAALSEKDNSYDIGVILDGVNDALDKAAAPEPEKGERDENRRA